MTVSLVANSLTASSRSIAPMIRSASLAWLHFGGLPNIFKEVELLPNLDSFVGVHVEGLEMNASKMRASSPDSFVLRA